jgi:lysine 6-dehydrogenase
MTHSFAILGAGMQGTAAAYDLAKFAPDASIVLGDRSLDQAQTSARRVNLLIGREVCRAVEVDALDAGSLSSFLKDHSVVLSCVPYWMHPKVAAVAIDHGVNMVDLGGNTEVTLETLGLHEKAKSAGVTLVPDCGLAPGLVNSLGLSLIEQLDEAGTVKMYCGVLPQNPKPPFNYKLTFNVEGLVTEYDYQAVTLRNGEIILVDTLDELESIEIAELGTMEAFTTSGGTSTAPYTLQGKVRNYEYKTIRFPGHCERMRIFKDFGFWREDTVDVPGGSVRPRDVFYKVFGESLARFEDQDMCAVRAEAWGRKDGVPKHLQVDIFDRQCSETGFTSMERLTGFSISIFAIEVAKGRIPQGCIRYESAMTGQHFVQEIQRRGIALTFLEA